jgi:hypothetical protein
MASIQRGLQGRVVLQPQITAKPHQRYRHNHHPDEKTVAMIASPGEEHALGRRHTGFVRRLDAG